MPGSLTLSKAASVSVINAALMHYSFPSTLFGRVIWKNSLFLSHLIIKEPIHSSITGGSRVRFACLIILFAYIFIYIFLWRVRLPSCLWLIKMHSTSKRVMYSKRCPPFNPGHTETQAPEALEFPWELHTLRWRHSQWVWFGY